MTNHRKAERFKAVTFTTVYDHNMDVILGFLGDLTLSGALIIGEKLLERNQEIILRMEFSEASDLPDKTFVVPAHIAWCQEQEDGIYIHTGVEFKDITPQTKNIIATVLEKYNFDDNITL